MRSDISNCRHFYQKHTFSAPEISAVDAHSGPSAQLITPLSFLLSTVNRYLFDVVSLDCSFLLPFMSIGLKNSAAPSSKNVAEIEE